MDTVRSTITRRSLLRRAALGAAATVAGGTALAVARGDGADAATTASSTGLQLCQPRYLGYAGADSSQPYAKYFTGKTSPVQPQIATAFAGPATATAAILPFSQLTTELNRPGYSAIETGYGMTSDGNAWAAAYTQMPGVTAAMWDWWFGWHSSQSARYKLWHPDAHAFASLKTDLTSVPFLTDRQRYVGNTSYVDEYIGDQLEQLAISFLDPVKNGFAVPNGSTVVYGRVGSSVVPVDLGWLCHQVRPVPGGAEMRSRFYLNLPGIAVPDPIAEACAISRGASSLLTQKLPFDATFARSLMQHCGAEMNHLSRFLPQLYAEFAHK